MLRASGEANVQALGDIVQPRRAARLCSARGRRPWFLCTEKAEGGKCCGRRIAKLYAGDDKPLFACRQCRGLAYTSQSETRAIAPQGNRRSFV